MGYWRSNVDHLLEFSERPVLKGAGSISKDQMETVAHQRYESFDHRRREAEAQAADLDDIKALEMLEKISKKNDTGS